MDGLIWNYFKLFSHFGTFKCCVMSPWQTFSLSSFFLFHSLKVILCCSEGKAAALSVVSYIRATPQWCSYVRNISLTGPNAFSLPLPSLRCFYPAGGTGSKTRERERPENLLVLVCLALKNKFLSWRKQTDGSDNWQRRKRERKEIRRRKEAAKSRDGQTARQTEVCVSQIKTHWTLLLGREEFSSLPPYLSPPASSKPLQLHACLHRPSGRKGIVSAEGPWVPASYTDWSGGFGKPYPPASNTINRMDECMPLYCISRGGEEGESVRF